MRTIKYGMMFWACCLFGLMSCYDDDTKVATDEKMINDIVLGELEDLSAVAFSTELNIVPEVKERPEYKYAWYIYGGEFSDNTENGYRTVKIGEEKKLSYKVNLKQGDYTLVFEVTDTLTGYAAIKEMKLKVSTAFSEGFYILKEISGKTELDVYNKDNSRLMANVLTSIRGISLQGEPNMLSVVYDMAHVDPESAESKTANAVFVAYGENNMACFRTEDLVQIFDRSTLLFGEMEADEIPYRIESANPGNFYFSSKGVRLGGSGAYSTGKMGYPQGSGASEFIQACDGKGLMFWNNQNCRLMYSSNSSVEEIEYYGTDINWNEVHPIATGWNHLAGTNTMWYVFENEENQRWLVLVNTKRQIQEVRRLNSGLHIAQANIISANGLTSYSIYAVHNNQVWRYSLDEGTETLLTFVGIPSSCEITYLSDIYFQKVFDYIVVGIQLDNEYGLYMYEIKGGQPSGELVHFVKGEGKLKQVRYVSQTSDWFTINYYAFTKYAITFGMGPDFPY